MRRHKLIFILLVVLSQSRLLAQNVQKWEDWGSNFILYNAVAHAEPYNRNIGIHLWSDKGFGMELHHRNSQWGPALFTRFANEAIWLGHYNQFQTGQSGFTPWMTLSDGNVGIGTATPNAKLSVIGATAGDGGTNSGTGALMYVKQNSAWGVNQPWALFVEGYSNLNGLRLNGEGGKRGVHKVSPGGLLGISTQGDDPITFTQNSEDERVRIASGGNVGIGTVSPAHKLDVAGAVSSRSYISDVGNASFSGDYRFHKSGTYQGRFIWYSGAYSSQASNNITVENSTGVPIAKFYESGGTSFGGNVAIGTWDPQGYKLAVNGDAIFTKVKVKPHGNWPDYVFHSSYHLPSLKEVEQYIKTHKHLPDVPSAKEVKEKGLDVGDNQAVLLKKIEEITLYMIEQQKQISALVSTVEMLQKQIGKDASKSTNN